MFIKRIAIIILGLTLFGCNPVMNNNTQSKTITDALGREVIIKNNVEKIVIAGKQAPMIANFYYLFPTAPEKLLAVEKRSQSSKDFLSIIDINFKDKQLLEKGAGAEQIAPLNPDVVILKTYMRESIGFQLEKLEIPVVYLEFEERDQIYRDLAILANILNEEKRGIELIEFYKKWEKEILNRIPNQESLNVLLIQADNEDEKFVFKVPSANWLQTNLIESVGGVAVWKNDNLSGNWAEINFEQILDWNPDLIMVINYQGKAKEIVEQLKKDPLWMELQAFQANGMLAFPSDFLSWDQPDPRWILGYGWAAKQVNPLDFNKDDIEKLVTSFYEIAYKMDEKSIEEMIMPQVRSLF